MRESSMGSRCSTAPRIRATECILDWHVTAIVAEVDVDVPGWTRPDLWAPFGIRVSRQASYIEPAAWQNTVAARELAGCRIVVA